MKIHDQHSLRYLSWVHIYGPLLRAASDYWIGRRSAHTLDSDRDVHQCGFGYDGAGCLAVGT